MEKALRRQAGADTVELDTIESYARFTLRGPKKIDFVAIQNAARAAAYTIKRLDIDVSGEVVRSSCGDCKDSSLFLKVHPTGQLLEIRGDIEVGKKIRLKASSESWTKEGILGFFTPQKHVVLRVDCTRAWPEVPAPKVEADLVRRAATAPGQGIEK